MSPDQTPEQTADQAPEQPESRCEVTDLPSGTCAHCRPAEPAETGTFAKGATISANYDAVCAHCGQGYPQDTTITHSVDHGGWVVTEHVWPERVDYDVDMTGFTDG